MHKVQKTYTAEFKREAVHLAQTSGKPIAHVARELGISDTSIPEWRKELTEHGPDAFPGSGHQTAQEEEVRRLKRELEVVKQERDAGRAGEAVGTHSSPSTGGITSPLRSRQYVHEGFFEPGAPQRWCQL